MDDNLINFQDCHDFPNNIFVYWKSKKLENNAKNVLDSFHYTPTLIRRAMECSNVIEMLKMLCMFYHLE